MASYRNFSQEQRDPRIVFLHRRGVCGRPKSVNTPRCRPQARRCTCALAALCAPELANSMSLGAWELLEDAQSLEGSAPPIVPNDISDK
jgi:hypothetical protein